MIAPMIPDKNGETFTSPPLTEYRRAIEQNRKLARSISIGGEPIEELARQARRLTMEDGARYTRALGLNPGAEKPAGGVIIASGHQPGMSHPGVMLKQIALAKQAHELGAQAIFFSVDSDEFKSESVPMPYADRACLVRGDYPLFPQTGKRLYETAVAPPYEIFMERLGAIKARIGEDARLDAIRLNISAFMKRMEPVDISGADYTRHIIAANRAWLAPVADGFIELPVSMLCRRAPFLKFVEDIIRRLDDFVRIYNEELGRYRVEHKLRYPANPFPDLARDEGKREAPFWAVTQLGREKLYAGAGPGALALHVESGAQWSVDDLVAEQIAIRPRAITLSIYLRLFLCDLFIHGVGGAKYDTITDRIIKRFYRVEPPSYACVTGTAWPPAVVEDPRERIEQITKTLRDIDHHPEKAGKGNDGLAQLADEKRSLIEKMKTPNVDKKELGAQISTLNKEMSARLAPIRQALETELETLESKERERKIVQARDYPFFLYDPETIARMIQDASDDCFRRDC